MSLGSIGKVVITPLLQIALSEQMILMITRIRRYQTIRQKAGDLYLRFYPASRQFSPENPLAKGGIGQGRDLGPLVDTEMEMENMSLHFFRFW